MVGEMQLDQGERTGSSKRRVLKFYGKKSLKNVIIFNKYDSYEGVIKYKKIRIKKFYVSKKNSEKNRK